MSRLTLAFGFTFVAGFSSQIAHAEPHSFNEADGLTDEQNILAGAFASKCFRALETVYLHHKDGMLDEALLAARLKGFQFFCEVNPVVPHTWKSGVRSGGGGMSDDFIDFMENAMPSLLSDG